MVFKEFKPPPILNGFIENYWVVIDEIAPPFEQKIIPDGYPEIIFHYGDFYEIKLFDRWEKQSKFLFSGQIRNHFFLKNSGKINILGIKLKPWAPHQLFKLNMEKYTDSVIPSTLLHSESLEELGKILISITPDKFVPEVLDKFFVRLVDNLTKNTPVINSLITKILDKKGQITIDELIDKSLMSRRSLERKFLEVVGLSPMYFSRIIRFNNIFKLMEARDSSWCQVAIDSGYYDQAHFIKEFKKFSGEVPSAYDFNDQTIANFFLSRN